MKGDFLKGNQETNLATFNQAGFQMVRLNELLQRCDRLSTNPFIFNHEMNLYNYEVIANDYSSIFLTISPKLKGEDGEKMVKTKKLLDYLVEKKPIFEEKQIKTTYSSKMRKTINLKNKEDIKTILFLFRQQLERAIDKYGLGNPDKADPSKAVIEW